jgi:hypothetical protein
VLLPFKPGDAARIVEETIAGKRKIEDVTMARVQVQNGQQLFAVNDFFIGRKNHASARYIIKYGGLKEPQSSSGVIVSTGLGSTGWMKSIIAGANRISSSVIGRPYGGKQESESLSEADEEAFTYDGLARSADIMYAEEAEVPAAEILAEAANFLANPTPPKQSRRARREKKKSYGPSELSSVVGNWSSPELLFAVREPFPSKTTGTNLVFGKISGREPLRIESLMGENGVIFSDGIESDFISFNSGTEAEIALADRKGHIVV